MAKATPNDRRRRPAAPRRRRPAGPVKDPMSGYASADALGSGGESPLKRRTGKNLARRR
jgi:hypothetical protein